MKRIGLSRLSALQPIVAVVRCERQSPGKLLHINIKSSGRSGASDTAPLLTARVTATRA